MCGRFTLTISPEVLAEVLGLVAVPALAPRYNVAPTDEIPIVRAAGSSPGEAEASRAPSRCVALARWGLVPSGAKDPKKIGAKMINARQETLFETPAFRNAARFRRCLVPADGFFEWKKAEAAEDGRPKAKVRRAARKPAPFRFRLKSGAPFAMAGVYERWRGAGGVVLDTCSIVTTEANALVAPIHDRMPVILDPKDYDVWLDPKIRDRAALERLFAPFPAEGMIAEPVSDRVNDVHNDDPSCIERAEEKEEERQLRFEI